jgi:single-strand DNA-binding protein
MKTLNRVQLIGLVGNNPKVYALANGTLVTRFSLATENIYKDKSTNSIKKSTEWHCIVLFGKLAEIAERFLQKGTQIHIEGSLKEREYEDEDKILRQVVEVIANDMIILSNGKDQPISPIFNFSHTVSNEITESDNEA